MKEQSGESVKSALYMQKQYPILYSFRRCPYAMRARLALAIAQQTYELREVVLRNKPQALLDASPKATVPVLVLPSGQIISESLDIMLWALRQNDPHAWLKPQQQDLQAALALISHADTFFKHHLDRYKYPNRYDLESGLPHRQAVIPWLSELNNLLQESSYLLGDRACIADMAIAPFIRQFAHTDKPWFWAQDWAFLLRWLDAFLNSRLFQSVMAKYSPWQPGDQAVLLTL